MGILNTINSSTASSSAAQESGSRPRELPPFVVCHRDGSPNNTFGHYCYYAMGNIPVSEFGICPTCFNETINPTPYGRLFRKVDINPDTPTMCDFSKSWVRTAWIWLYRAYASDSRLLATVSSLQVPEGMCPNPKKKTLPAIRKWFSVRDPDTRRTLDQFTTCSYCKACVETILPSLKGIFVPAAGGATCQGTCDLPPYSHRKAQYEVILFQMAQDTRAKPDMTLLVQFIKNFSGLNECRKKSYVKERHWVSPAMPALTICDSCHHEKFNLSGNPSSAFANAFTGGFQVSDTAIEFSCQLYSPRMRALWDNAMATGDLSQLRDFVNKRSWKLREFTHSYSQAEEDFNRWGTLSNQLGDQAVRQNQDQLSSDFNMQIAGWRVIVRFDICAI